MDSIIVKIHCIVEVVKQGTGEQLKYASYKSATSTDIDTLPKINGGLTMAFVGDSINITGKELIKK